MAISKRSLVITHQKSQRMTPDGSLIMLKIAPHFRQFGMKMWELVGIIHIVTAIVMTTIGKNYGILARKAKISEVRNLWALR